MCGLTRVPQIMSLTKCRRSGWLPSRVVSLLQCSQLSLSSPGWMGSQRASWLATTVNSLWKHKVPARAFLWLHVTKSAKSLSPSYLALTISHLLLHPKANSQGTEGGRQPDCMGYHKGQGAPLVTRNLDVLERQWVMVGKESCCRPQARFAFSVYLSCSLQSLSL